MTGTTFIVLGLTWGGIRFPWSSWQVLVPLFVGLALLAGFIMFEAKVPKMPLVSMDNDNNKTSETDFNPGPITSNVD